LLQGKTRQAEQRTPCSPAAVACDCTKEVEKASLKALRSWSILFLFRNTALAESGTTLARNIYEQKEAVGVNHFSTMQWLPQFVCGQSFLMH
jgi:hypothetical protein